MKEGIGAYEGARGMEHTLYDELDDKGKKGGSRRNIQSASYNITTGEQKKSSVKNMNTITDGRESRDRKSSASRFQRRGDTKAVTGKVSNSKNRSKTPRHLKADDWFRHDTHLTSGKKQVRTMQSMANNVVNLNKSTQQPKVLRSTVRPPASPAACQAAEEKASRSAYRGAAGVSAAHNAQTKTPGYYGVKMVGSRNESGLFRNLQYPNA